MTTHNTECQAWYLSPHGKGWWVAGGTKNASRIAGGHSAAASVFLNRACAWLARRKKKLSESLMHLR